MAACAALLAGAVLLISGPSPARSTLDDFLAAWEAEDHETAGSLTDGSPNAVATALTANIDGLDGAVLTADVEEFSEEGRAAEADVRLAWEIPGIGRWDYVTAIGLREEAGEWLVRWDETVVHPELERGQRLGTEREFAERAPILDRRGEPLVENRPVIDINLLPRRLEDEGAAVEAVTEATEAEPGTLRRALDAADPQTLVTAITLREEELEPIEDELDDVPGVQFAHREQPLAPTREFGRAVLGTVAPATAEQLRELGSPYVAGDQVGQAGLQAAFEERLAGLPTRRVVVRRRSDGAPVDTLHEVPGEKGEPLRTTLDRDVQEAAERALGLEERKAAMVAIEPSSGDLLAVANRPVDDTFNRAFEGQYPPGSAFKVVTTAALLREGLDVDETVDCPASLTVGGRVFVNFEGSAQGAVPFRTDFAESCNTAFVSLAERLSPDSLPPVAADFGFGRRHELPLASFAGDVPVDEEIVDRAASMIGQGEVLASPLTLAGVAATVAAGRWRAPRLLDDDPSTAGPTLAREELRELRSLMRLVVTSGTGTALASLPGEVAGKSGTAEYGTADPPRTHAWFIAFRGDLAVAVLVENGESGGEVAAPIAADFFSAPDG